MSLSRRKFLGWLGAAGVAATGSGRKASAATTHQFEGYPESMGVLHDTTLCIGCRRCEGACNTVNELPAPEQTEMPFAVVMGKAVTELPKDLYIPPQALEVFLEAFEGPLDLLLYLIKRQNIDILNIPIASITKQYMDYIGLMEKLELELLLPAQ